MARSFPQAVSGFAVTGFAIALAALVSSQLALMSVLDTARAEHAADQIARSRFVADVITQTVDRAIAPLAGDAIAKRLATTAGTDPRIEQTVHDALIDAHRQVVDPEAPVDLTDGTANGNAAVNEAIVRSVVDAATAAGIDLDAVGLGHSELDSLPFDTIAERAGLPSVVPDDVPNLGLRRVAETTRWIASLVAFVLAFAATFAHPRSGRGLGRVGLAVLLVCTAWLAGLLVTGWVIGLVAETLFGEMLDDVWRDAVPSMLLLTIGGAVIGSGLWFGGMTLDGWAQTRRRERALR